MVESQNSVRQNRQGCCSDLLEPPGRELVYQARDQRLIRQPLCEGSLLDRLQVLTRQPDVQPPVLAECGLGVAGVPSSLALAAASRLPLATLDRLEQLLLVGVNLHGRTPHRGCRSPKLDRNRNLKEADQEKSSAPAKATLTQP